jgi:hypothetical protein
MKTAARRMNGGPAGHCVEGERFRERRKISRVVPREPRYMGPHACARQRAQL